MSFASGVACAMKSSTPARLAIVAEDQTGRILKYEPEMRAVLRLSLEGVRPPELPMHRGLRIAWIEDAVSHPARIICPRSNRCPRPERCEGARPSKAREIADIREEILGRDA